MFQAWRAEILPKFIQACEAAADRRQCSCAMTIGVPQNLRNRGIPADAEVLKRPLQELLKELGFPEGTVTQCNRYDHGLGVCIADWKLQIQVRWSPEDADCKVSPPQTSRGTCTTCPICHEHRPAVALIPCGHVICRDCHRSQQLRQCPMCRGPITSATNGLFMD